MSETAISSVRTERHDGWTAERRQQFLEVLGETGCVTAAARAVAKSKPGAYMLRQRDPEFAEAWELALTSALDSMEAAIMARVLHGVEKPVIYRGEQVATTREYSDALAMFMLRRHRPEAYGRVREMANAEQRKPTAAAEPSEEARVAQARVDMEQRLEALAVRLHDTLPDGS